MTGTATSRITRAPPTVAAANDSEPSTASATPRQSSAASDGFVPPTGAAGWAGTAGVSLSFLLGFVCYFFGVKTIGETRSAVIANLEPVVAVLGAFALLGESFTPLQGTGAVLTLGGVTALVWEDARLKRRPALAD